MTFTKGGPRVAEEAAALDRARHPGVVELLGVEDGVLRTRLVDGPSLAEAGPLTADEVAGVAAAVASTLADLHDRGVVHGGIDATHVLVGADGRPVLCSLGRGGAPADDVAALGRLVADLLGAAPAALPRPPVGRRRLGAMLAPPAAPVLTALAAEAAAPDPAQRLSAREVAAEVHRRVPTARLRPPGPRPLLPVPPPPGSPPRAARQPRRRAVAVAVVALALAGAASYALAPRGGGGVAVRAPAPDPPPERPPAAAEPPPPEPVAARVWPAEPLDFRDGVLTVDGARYAVGAPGDHVVAGDWGCTGRRTLVLLRAATGEVFAFDGWPEPGHDLPARPVDRVPGASGMRVADTDGDGCADLEVVVPGGAPRSVAVAG